MSIALKRIYEPVVRGDGRRYLIDRLWPRGITKARAHLDGWLKQLAPSEELRKWFRHRPERFGIFRKRYVAELALATEELDRILEESTLNRVTLLYGARDPKTSHAVVLLECLQRRAKHRSRVIGAESRQPVRDAFAPITASLRRIRRSSTIRGHSERS